MDEMSKAKTTNGTKVFIQGVEVFPQSVSMNLEANCLLTAKIELPIESINHDSKGNLVIRLLER